MEEYPGTDQDRGIQPPPRYFCNPARLTHSSSPRSFPLLPFSSSFSSSLPLPPRQLCGFSALDSPQDAKNKKLIHCDEKLKTIFDGKDSVEFLEVSRLLSQHFRKAVV